MPASSPPSDLQPTPHFEGEDLHSEDEALQVLLVEDNPGDARLFEEYVEESSTEATIRHEETLQAGLQALEKPRPDVLVVDLGLPDSEGTETVEAAVAAAPEVPIVVLTGQDDLQVALQAHEAGAAEYLQKDELGPALVGRTLRWALRQHRMQAKLRQRDAWIRSITEGLSAGVFRAGPTGRIEYANEALAEMLGVETEEELIGLDLTTFYADPLQKGRMLAEEGASEVEVEFEGQDGSTFVGLLSATVLYDENGAVLHYDGTVTDITERAKRKERLRMLSKAVEQATEAVLITEAAPLDEPGPRVEYVNSACEEMTGYSREEMTGKTPRILQGPETDREVLDSLREALEAGEEWEGETINYRKDGEPYQVQWNVAPVRGGDGEVEHWGSVQRDVTERRKREERLRLLAEALEQVGDKVMITDLEGQIQYVNEAFEEITGYSKEEVLGKTPRVVQSGEQSEDFYEELRETLRSGETFRAELENERKDGTRYVEEEVITPVTDEDGQVTHFVSTGRDVTERKRRKRELERQNDLFERAQEIANVGAWEYDLQKEEGTMTDQAYRIHGLPPGSDMTPEKSLGFYHAEDRSTIQKAFSRAVEEGRPYDIEVRLTTKEGEERWVRTRGEPQREAGELVRIRGTIRDITERKRAEQSLQVRESQLRGLTNSIPGVVFQAYARPGWEYGFYLVSDRAEEFLGISPDPADFFERCISRVPEPERNDLLSTVDRAVDSEDPLRFEAPFVKPSGDTIWLLGTATPEPQEDELLYNGVILDISERKRHQKRLAKTVERVTNAIVEVDSDWRFTLVNDQAEELYDVSEEDLLGRDFWEVFEAALGTRFEEEYRGVMRARTPAQFEEYYSGLDGWFDIQVYPNDDGGLAFYFTEITERKKREEALREAKEEAERMNRLKSAFLANMSHEIRTPLTSILGFAEAIAEEIGAAEDADDVDLPTLAQFSSLIERSGQRLMDTLTGVLNLSKLQAGEMDLDLGPVDLATEVLFEPFRQASEGFAREYEGTGVGLAVTKKAVEQMGGSIEVETEMGEGSRFTVRFPMA